MTTATAPATFSVSIHTADSAKYIRPTATLAEGILDGMMDSQRELGQISWEEITMEYAKGRVVTPSHSGIKTGTRVVVMDSHAENDFEEATLNFLFEN